MLNHSMKITESDDGDNERLTLMTLTLVTFNDVEMTSSTSGDDRRALLAHAGPDESTFIDGVVDHLRTS